MSIAISRGLRRATLRACRAASWSCRALLAAILLLPLAGVGVVLWGLR